MCKCETRRGELSEGALAWVVYHLPANKGLEQTHRPLLALHQPLRRHLVRQAFTHLPKQKGAMKI
jgi:hypothetical protein